MLKKTPVALILLHHVPVTLNHFHNLRKLPRNVSFQSPPTEAVMISVLFFLILTS